MANLKLSSASSIVDFLKSVDHASDFNSRKAIYRAHGLDRRLGTFVGSEAQNRALLKLTQGLAARGITKFHESGHVPPLKEGLAEIQRGLGEATKTLDLAKSQSAADIKAGQALEFEPGTAKPVEIVPGIPKPAEGATAANLGIPAPVSGEDALKQAFESPKFKLFTERQAAGAEIIGAEALATKSELERKTATRQKELEESFGRRGLFMSGIRAEQVRGLAEELAASKLEVDRKTAARLLEQNFDLRERILGDVADIAKNAQAGRKEAISALEKVGLTVIGDRVVPTLAAQAAQRAEEAARRAEAKFEASKFETRTIGDRVVRFEFDSKGNVIGKTDLGPSGEAGFTRGERNALAFDAIATQAAQELEKNRGAVDKFYDPKIFMKYREIVKTQAPTFIDDFDKKFANSLNPVDAKRLGITQEDLDPFAEIRRKAQGK